MITGENIKDASLLNRNLGSDMPKFGHTYELFRHDPVAALKGGAAASGSTGARNLLTFGSMNVFEQHVKGAGQTIVVPVLTDVGLDIGQDQASTEGIELTQGITARAKHAYVIGTDGPFFLRAKIKIEDASGCNPLVIGFRKAEAYQTAVASYADYAAVGIIGTANPNTIKTTTETAAGGNTDTDTTKTWADGATKELKVVVSAKGAVTYYLDGLKLDAAPAFSLANALTVVPFLFFLHSADVAGVVELIEWECGLVAAGANLVGSGKSRKRIK